MKSRKFSKLSFDDTQILTREELKRVLGGDGYGCDGYAGGNYGSGGTCAYYLPHGSGSGGPIATYNVSKGEACTMINGVSGAHWCCDSCSSASWYGI